MNETVGHYLRNGSNPIIVTLDCKGAFDTCKWSKLFGALDEHLPPVVTRILLYSYIGQETWVEWRGECSGKIKVANGTGQGKVALPLFWSLYILPLLLELRKLGVGCHLNGHYVGSLLFCDDIILVTPSRGGGAMMLRVCEQWGETFGVEFSSDPNPLKSKSKCIQVTGNRKKVNTPEPLTLNGRKLPFVETASHVGHTISKEGTQDTDSRKQRAEFIRKSCEVREQFSFAFPDEQLRAVKLYAGDSYGAVLWDLQSEESAKYFRCWNRTIKDCFNIPLSTRTHYVENLFSRQTSLKTDVLSRFHGFFQSLRSSSSKEVRTVAEAVRTDLRTTTGRNVDFLSREVGGNPFLLRKAKVKEKLELRKPIPAEDLWVADTLMDLVEYRMKLIDTEDKVTIKDELEMLDESIGSLCS